MKLATFTVDTAVGRTNRLGIKSGDELVDATTAYAAYLDEQGDPTPVEVAECVCPPSMAAFLRRGDREPHQSGHRQRRRVHEEGRVPSTGGERAPDDRVGCCPKREHGRRDAHDGVVLSSVVSVSHHRHRQCRENTSGGEPLDDAQAERYREVVRESDGCAGEPKDGQGPREDVPPTDAVGERADERGEQDTRKRIERDEQANT